MNFVFRVIQNSQNHNSKYPSLGHIVKRCVRLNCFVVKTKDSQQNFVNYPCKNLVRFFHLKDSTWYAFLRGVLSSVFGCQSETRTHNLRINSALLYRLSYPTICRITLAILQNIIKGVVFNYKLFANCKTKIKLWDIIFFSKILADKISLNENNTLITNNCWLIVTSCSFTEQLIFKS